MARLALAAAGYGIGFAIGGPLGGQIGWAAGSFVGALVSAEDVVNEGPRLTDRSQAGADYGLGIKWVLGTTRVAGQLIWQEAIAEHRHEETESAKGGPDVTTVSYSYSQSFEEAVARGPIIGIRRIWANGELIYNVGDDADAVSVTASDGLYTSLVIYKGSESEDPDPIESASVGADACPAYLGVARVRFEGLQLERFGNRRPFIEYEVVGTGAVTPAVTVYPVAGWTAGQIGGGYYLPDRREVWCVRGGVLGQFAVVDLTTGAARNLAYAGAQAFAYDIVPQMAHGLGWLSSTSSGKSAAIDLATGLVVRELATYSQFVGTSDDYVLGHFGGGVFKLYHWQGSEVWSVALGTLSIVTSATDRDGAIYATTGTAGAYTLWKCTDVGQRAYPVPDPLTNLIQAMAYDSSRHCLWLSCQGPVGNTAYIYQFDITSGTFALAFTVAPASTDFLHVVYEPKRDMLVFFNGSAKVRRYTVTGTQISSSSLTSGGADVCHFNRPAYDNGMVWGVTTGSFSSNNVEQYHIDALDPTAPTVASVLDAIAADVGLSVGQVDTSAVVGSLEGFVIADRAPARGAVEQLMTAFGLDAVESGGKVKFVSRGGASIRTIPAIDMGAGADRDQVRSLEMTRGDDPEQPAELSLVYHDKALDHLPNVQPARRLIGGSQNRVRVQLAMTLTADHARRTAETMLHQAWIARQRVEFALTRKHAELEPTDVITVPGETLAYTVRILDEDNQGPFTRFSAVVDDASVYTQTNTGAIGRLPDHSIAVTSPSRLVLLDGPLLRDRDDGPGFYVAGGPAVRTLRWTGQRLFRSLDSGQSYGEMADGVVTQAAPIGTASTVLGAFEGGNMVDELNTVTVVLSSSALSSTSEANMLAGYNAAMIGAELVQFRTATLVAANTYTLSGLLRGRKGTEWAMYRHAIGDRFVALSSAAVIRVATDAAELNKTRDYKGVTFGQRLTDAYGEAFTFAGVSQKPLSPTEVGIGRDASGNITVQWVRRARIGAELLGFASVPLDETTEAYEIDVFGGTAVTLTAITNALDGLFSTSTPHGLVVGNPCYLSVTGMPGLNDLVATVTEVPANSQFKAAIDTRNMGTFSAGSLLKRGATLTSSTGSLAYPAVGAGSQTTHFGGAQNPLAVAVYQMSALVGRGYAGTRKG